jgi:hypothetical protein
MSTLGTSSSPGRAGIGLALGLGLLLAACRSNPPAGPPRDVKTYGQPLAAAETLPITTLVARPDGYAGKAVTVEGSVRSACTNRGCWLELAEGAPGGAARKDTPGCRVTFKDYGFFIPTNSAGARAKVQGTFELATVSAERVRHMESEGATFGTKQPDGTARELRLVATGVELWRER